MTAAPAPAARRRWPVLVAGALTAAAAALALWFLPGGTPASPPSAPPAENGGLVADVRADWERFGRRLARMAQVRREGGVPRIGTGSLEVPPASATGYVFGTALDTLRVAVDADVRDEVEKLVTAHHVWARGLGEGIEAEALRADASLHLFRRLRDVAGTDVADAYYDVFRPGLADLHTAVPVSGSLELVVHGDRYVDAYEEAIRTLARRYGEAKVQVVLQRIAPRDRRFVRRDAHQDGVGRDAVLAMRARLYRAAAEAGADRLYVALRS